MYIDMYFELIVFTFILLTFLSSHASTSLLRKAQNRMFCEASASLHHMSGSDGSAAASWMASTCNARSNEVPWNLTFRFGIPNPFQIFMHLPWTIPSKMKAMLPAIDPSSPNSWGVRWPQVARLAISRLWWSVAAHGGGSTHHFWGPNPGQVRIFNWFWNCRTQFHCLVQ